jgi:hypothetical protein
MSLGKLAAIMSANAPPFVGKPPPKMPATRPKTLASPGLGEKMRQETGSALESALGGNRSFSTGLENLVKAAAALPTATVAGANPFMSAMRSLPSRALRPVKRGLGLAALGAGGALAYGMHRQNVEDRENNPLVYAPMQGTVMG